MPGRPWLGVLLRAKDNFHDSGRSVSWLLTVVMPVLTIDDIFEERV